MTAPLHVIILAAGEGKRMKSAVPKVLQKIAGRPMLAQVIDTARALRPQGIHVVYGHGGDQVRAAFADQHDLQWAEPLLLDVTDRNAVAATIGALPPFDVCGDCAA